MPETNLLKALENITKSKDKEKAIKDLDTLLGIDFKTPAFKQHILDNWKEYYTPLAGEVDSSFDNPQRLHQEAAKQRVILKLDGADKEVLVEILKHNPNEIRAYLAKKGLIDGTKTFDWKKTGSPAPAAPAQLNDSILTDNAIKDIQTKALVNLYLKLIEKAKTLEELQKENLINELSALLPPNTLSPAQLVNGMELSELSNCRLPKVKKFQENALAAYVASLNHKQLEAFKVALGNNDKKELQLEVFKRVVGAGDIRALINDDNFDAFRNKLRARYLNQMLAEYTLGKEKNLLSLPDDNTLRAELAKLLNIIVDVNVNEAELKEIRKALLIQLIQSDKNEENLTKIEQTTSFEELQKIIGDEYKVKTEYLSVADYKVIKQAARTSQFSVALAKIEFAGQVDRPELYKAFALLPDDKQQKLISEPKTLKQLVATNREEVVRQLLGTNVVNAKQITKENADIDERALLFKRVLNAEIARILFNYKPKIKLTEDELNKINTKIAAATLVNTAIGKEQYLQLIHGITLDLKITVDKKAYFLEKFNVNHVIPPQLKDNDGEITTKIISTQQKNSKLFPLYGLAGVNRKLIELFTSFELDYSAISDAQRDKIKEFHKQTVEDFIKAMGDDPKGLAEKLKQHAATLRELKLEQFEEKINDVPQVAAAVKECREAIAKFNINYEILKDNAKVLTPLLAVKDRHLMNPAFQSRARKESKEMLARYRELAEQNELIINQLIREQSSLMGYRLKLGDEQAGEQQIVKQLRKDLDEKLLMIKDVLESYRKIRDNLNENILPAVENAAEGKTNYLYKAQHMSCSVGSKSQLKAADTTTATLTLTATRELMNFNEVDALTEGQQRDYDYAPEFTVAGGAKVTLHGKFSEAYNDDTPGEPEGTFRVEKFPENPKEGPKLTDEVLAAARVEFSLALAIQALSALKEMPTHEKPITLTGNNADQVRYLYTALIELGVSKHAIANNTLVFTPDKEYGWFGNYSGDSLGATVFANSLNKAKVAAAMKDLQQVRDLKDDKTGQRHKVNEATKEAVKALKDEHQKAKQEFEDEGPAKERKPGL